MFWCSFMRFPYRLDTLNEDAGDFANGFSPAGGGASFVLRDFRADLGATLAGPPFAAVIFGGEAFCFAGEGVVAFAIAVFFETVRIVFWAQPVAVVIDVIFPTGS